MSPKPSEFCYEHGSTFAFMALGVAAAGCQLLEFYGLLNWDADKDAILTRFQLGGLALWVILLFWSLFSVRRHKIRAIIGALICAYCLWQAFQNGKILF